jgi:hypothetical protein
MCNAHGAGHGKHQRQAVNTAGLTRWAAQDGPVRDGGTAARRCPEPVAPGPAARRDNPRSATTDRPVNLPEPHAYPPFGMSSAVSEVRSVVARYWAFCVSASQLRASERRAAARRCIIISIMHPRQYEDSNGRGRVEIKAFNLRAPSS